MKFEFFFNTRRIKDLDLWMGDFIISGGRAVLDIHILINPYTGTVRGDIPLDIMSTAVILRPMAYNMTIDINVLSMASRSMASILPIEPFIMGQVIYFRGGIEILSIFTMSYVKIYDHARAYIEIDTATARYQSRPQFIDIEIHTLVSMPQRFESFITIDLSQSVSLLQLGGIPFKVIDINVSISKPKPQTAVLEIESSIIPKTSMNIRPVEIIEIGHQIVWKYQGKGLGETVDIDTHASQFRSNVTINPIVIEFKPNNPYFIRPPVVLDISQNVYWSKPGSGLNKPIDINTQAGPFKSYNINNPIAIDSKPNNPYFVKPLEMLNIGQIIHWSKPGSGISKPININVQTGPFRSYTTINPLNINSKANHPWFIRPLEILDIGQRIHWSKPGGSISKLVDINVRTSPFRSHHVNKMIGIDVKPSPYRSHPTDNPVNVDAKVGFMYLIRPNELINIRERLDLSLAGKGLHKLIDISTKMNQYRPFHIANPVDVDARTGFRYFLRPNKMIPINIAIINIMPRTPSERINIDGKLGLTRYIRSGEFLNITLRIDMRRSNANIGERINISTRSNNHNRRTFFIYAELFQKTGLQRSARVGEFIEPNIMIHVERQRRQSIR